MQKCLLKINFRFTSPKLASHEGFFWLSYRVQVARAEVPLGQQTFLIQGVINVSLQPQAHLTFLSEQL